MLKSRIRKEIKEKLNKQNDTQRLRKSHLIKEKLFKLAEFKRAKFVMFYIATNREVETHFMITEAKNFGKKIVVPMILVRERSLPARHKEGQAGPVTNVNRIGLGICNGAGMIASLIEDTERELSLGPYGLLQPKRQYIREVPPEEIDLVVVPGLAFDKQGRRLGRGRGYYDKFLARLPSATPRIGLAFDFQVFNDLPTLSHDVSVTRVISA